MTITTRLIGKLGGAAVESVPVSVNTSDSGVWRLHTVDVPEGERYLVAVSGHIAPGATSSGSAPQLRVGGATSIIARDAGPIGLAVEATETVSVSLIENRSAGNTSFTGTVWWVPLD